LKHKFLAVLVALACGVAQAADRTWTFSYTGFYNQDTQLFDPTFSIAGSFTGEDRNGDGSIDGTELASFWVDTTEYVGCGSVNSPYYNCGMDHFWYKNGSLQFNTTVSSQDPEGIVSHGQVIQAGSSVYSYLSAPFGSSESTMKWTNRTQFALQSPVPEADAYAMLLTGLACLGLVARRRNAKRFALA